MPGLIHTFENKEIFQLNLKTNYKQNIQNLYICYERHVTCITFSKLMYKMTKLKSLKLNTVLK